MPTRLDPSGSGCAHQLSLKSSQCGVPSKEEHRRSASPTLSKSSIQEKFQIVTSLQPLCPNSRFKSAAVLRQRGRLSLLQFFQRRAVTAQRPEVKKSIVRGTTRFGAS